MALRSGEATNSFWERLVAYIEDKNTLLMSFKLFAKDVLVLLSNQVVQIRDNIYEFCGNAANVDITERGPAAARFAWVTLQAQNCMGAYLKDKFCNHCALNSTFVRFLTRHMANQTALGLKTEVEKLRREVGDLKAAKAVASQDALNKLDGKVSTIIRLNNLKTRECIPPPATKTSQPAASPTVGIVRQMIRPVVGVGRIVIVAQEWPCWLPVVLAWGLPVLCVFIQL